MAQGRAVKQEQRRPDFRKLSNIRLAVETIKTLFKGGSPTSPQKKSKQGR